MSLIYFSTCGDYYASAQLFNDWDQSSGGGSILIGPTYARFSSTNGSGFGLNNTWLRKILGSSTVSTVIISFSMAMQAYPKATDAICVLEDTGVGQVSICVDILGRLIINRGTGSGTALTSNSGAYTLGIGQYHRFEFKVLFSASVGTVELRMDGATSPLLTASGLNTIVTANSSMNAFRIGDCDNQLGTLISGPQQYVDDVLLLDNQSGSLNGFLGDRKLLTAMPNGAGAFSAWTPNGPANNWQCVNSIPPQDDIAYVSDNNANDRDTYTFQPLTFSGSADFAALVARARKDDSNVHTFQLNARSNSVDAFSASITPASSYTYWEGAGGVVSPAAFLTDPNTSAAWTQTGLNAAQFGVKLIS